MNDQQRAAMIKCACGDAYPADSFGAGFIAATGHCQNCDMAQPQDEPVAWMNPYKSYVKDAFFWKQDKKLPDFSVPVYTTPPSVEAMRIETLEKAAKKCEGLFADAIFDAQTAGVVGMVVNKIAAAIRSMK